MTRLRPAWLLAGIMALSAGATVLAMRQTSTTFDEIVLIAAGARGYTNGEFDLAPDHPPLMQYLYGLPAFLAKPNLPDESGQNAGLTGYRYRYAQQFFWRSGNDPERLAFLGRLPAALLALLLVFTVYAFTKRLAGTTAALMGALLVAFLPDVLAHGGVAYNDVPLALTFFLAAWALDAVIRAPTWQRGLIAGASVGLALGIKISAVALVGVALALLALEFATRPRAVRWLPRIALTSVVALGAAYLTLVLIYRGDFALTQFRYALGFTFQHVTRGHGAAGYLLGDTSVTGWWYFFPMAFLFKTPVALHILAVIALLALARTQVTNWRDLLASKLRVPVIAAMVFGAALLTSNLNIGFRYALPMLPPLCILIAVGVARVWAEAAPRLRVALGALLLWAVVSPLSYYPYFLSYISEYGPGRDRGSEVLVDSSLDWGQGLLELRDYLRENQIPRVFLSYFGSALPDGYGIDYVPLASFFRLQPSTISPPGARRPEYVVVSATNLRGAYFDSDPFAFFRTVQPDAVVAHTLYVYRIRNQSQSD